MWEEGKHLPCHYSRLSQFNPTPNLQLPLPSFHPSTSVWCTTVNERGGYVWRWALQIVTPAALLKGPSVLLTTLYGGGERESRPLTWARAGTWSQPGLGWQIGNELLCVVRLRFGHCAPPRGQMWSGIIRELRLSMWWWFMGAIRPDYLSHHEHNKHGASPGLGTTPPDWASETLVKSAFPRVQTPILPFRLLGSKITVCSKMKLQDTKTKCLAYEDMKEIFVMT